MGWVRIWLMSASEIPALGATTSVRQVGRKAGSGGSFSSPIFICCCMSIGAPRSQVALNLNVLPRQRVGACFSQWGWDLPDQSFWICMTYGCRPYCKSQLFLETSLSCVMLSPALNTGRGRAAVWDSNSCLFLLLLHLLYPAGFVNTCTSFYKAAILCA